MTTIYDNEAQAIVARAVVSDTPNTIDESVAGPAGTVSALASLGKRSSRIREINVVAKRSLKVALRDPQALIPNLFVGLFFFVVNVGSFQKVAPHLVGGSVKEFQLPVAIMFAVTGVSRASQVVLDIERGYLDRLLVKPIRRSSLLVGMMAADTAIVLVMSSLVVAAGVLSGAGFKAGFGGMLAFIGFSTVWALAYSGFPYAIALKSGSPDAVQAASFMLFFPFAFLTTAFLPIHELAGWMQPIARWNPVTYVLKGMRSLLLTGWSGRDLGEMAIAIVVVGAAGLTLASNALKGRIEREA